MAKMTMTSRAFAQRHGGFTLIEILISVVIGLLGIVVMFQVLTLWDSLKRTTAAGSDAQISGTVAMFALERDIKPAGMGFGKGADGLPVPSLGCKVSAKSPQAFSAVAASPDFFSLVPVRIIDGAAGAPDQIVTVSGNSSLFVSTQKFKDSTASTKTIDGSYGGFKVGDVVVAGGATAAADCQLLEVSDVATPGVIGHATALRFNPAPAAIAATSGFLYNLGPLPQRNVWSIQNEKLYRQDSLYSAADTEVADNVIDLQAQYGVDSAAGGGTADDGILVDGDWTATEPAAADWKRVIAIRVALLTRSQQFEKTQVTPAAPSWAGGAFTMANIAGAAGDVADWQRYRYRVYEKVIPLRNMVWGGDFK